MTALVVFGPPGAGKGTQAKRLSEELGIRYIATGNLFRQHRRDETPLGKAAAQYIVQGRLVPDEIVVAIVRDELARTEGEGFVLDGFPRTRDQAQSLWEVLDEVGAPSVAAVLIDVPDDVVVTRISGRRQCPDGHVFHLVMQPPVRDGICDHDGLPLLQRDDDRPETIRERLRVYHDETAPLIELYESRGLLRRVDGGGAPDDVYAEIKRAVAARDPA